MKKQLTKSASFTDIHWGAKANSEQHNVDCLRFVDWFCDQVRQDSTIDHISFLGDWFENRSAINVSTLTYAYYGAKKLNELGLPVFFVVGNHDLYHRHTREVFSTLSYEEFENFTLINEPKIIENIGDGALFTPYLFREEYPELAKYLELKTWWGHFEFQGFIITGYNRKMDTGPKATDFEGPNHIFSGHFHKRQADKNVVYIGNAFPFTFGDAGDFDRGMMVYDHEKDEALFYNWEDCPKYLKVNLSDMIDEKVQMYSEARVKCLVDIPINFEESNLLRQKFMKDYNLRELIMEESSEAQSALADTHVSEKEIQQMDEKLSSVNDLVVHMLEKIESDHINPETLIKIYREL